jgi:hypothetical protein
VHTVSSVSRHRRAGRTLAAASLLVLGAAMLFSLPAGGQARSAVGSSNPFTGVSPAVSIVFVPLDARAHTLIAATAPTVQKWLPPSVRLRTIPAKRSNWINKARGGEWNGVAVANDLLADFKSAQGNRQVFMLAVSSEAVYDPGTPQFTFVFGLLWWRKPQFAAVYGTRPMRVFQPTLERLRLTKMMLRYIGQIVCNQPRNSDPHSVLYKTILGTPDLDRMVATLPPACRR